MSVARQVRPTRGRSILDTIQRLSLATVLPFEGGLGLPLDPMAAVKPLRDVVADIHSRRANRAMRPPTAATIDQALSAWVACTPEVQMLSARFIRALCSYAPIVNDADFLKGLASHPDLPRRRRWIESLIGLYESTWRSEPNASLLELLLQNSIARCDIVSHKLQRVGPYAKKLFDQGASSWIAASALNEGRPVLEVLDSLSIPHDTALARASVEATAREWSRLVNAQDGVSAGTLALLEYGLKTILGTSIIDSAALRLAASTAILWAPEADERVTKMLSEWLLADPRFGDQRLPANQPKWATMPAPARERALRWLAKGDLLFFFDFVLPTRLDPHGRKQFWLRYIEQVTDVSVALSPIDADRLRLSVTQKLRYARATSPSGDVSAFIMRFRGSEEFVVAEFSQTGNAAYLHDANRFDALVGGMRQRSYAVATHPKGLKSAVAMRTRYVHKDGWEAVVERELASLGIRRRRR